MLRGLICSMKCPSERMALLRCGNGSRKKSVRHNDSFQSIPWFRHQLKRLSGILQGKAMRNHCLFLDTPITEHIKGQPCLIWASRVACTQGNLLKKEGIGYNG